MKKIFALALLFSLSFLSAQSDYETTQDFKDKAKVITEAIKNIQDKSELSRIESAIIKLKSDFSTHKDLLDKALYPDNFESVLTKLNKSLRSKKRSLNKINSLENKITDMRIQITDLNDKNLTLLNDIKELNRLRSNDSAKISELRSKVRVLGKQIKERDNLVLGVVDSLLNDFVNKKEPITDASRYKLERTINSRDLFTNIKRTLNDNIDFLDVTVFTPEDLLELKTQNQKFREVWDKLGPQLTQFYLNKAEKRTELQTINKLFQRWDEKIDTSVWQSIDYHFKAYDVKLMPFNSGNEFTANILAFITLEINSAEKKQPEELFRTYNTFVDSVWAKEIRPNWLPMLIENSYMSTDQRNTIEEKFVNWEIEIDNNNELTTIYIVFGILFLIFATFVIKKYKN